MRAFVRASKSQLLPTIGDLRRRIMVARRTRQPEGFHQFTETMTLVTKLWARVTNLEGVAWDGSASNQEQTWPTHEFLVRRAPSFEPDQFDHCYVIYGLTRYRIGSLWDYDNTARFLGLICTVEQKDEDGVERPWQLVTEDGEILIGE